MKMRGKTVHLAVVSLGVAGLIAACSYDPPPVPVTGDPEARGVLAGEWSGSYQGRESGRSGSLFFRLGAGADTARGDVLMAPVARMHPAVETEEWEREVASPLLTIRFVRAEGNLVYGRLDEYRDPQCGCLLQTTFTGRIEGNEIEGTFTTLHIDSGQRHSGTWNARRTGPPPPAAELAPAAPRPAAEPTPAPEPAPAPEPGLKGPSESELVERGRQLFTDLGCAFCHGGDRSGRIGPALTDVTEHRSFGWIYHMILRPDSMVRNDPVARAMYDGLDIEMPLRGASPWEALVLYEYLLAAWEGGRPEPRR